MKNYALLFVFTLLLLKTQSQPIADFINNSNLNSASISICITNIKSEEILYKSKPQLCISPASVLKLITTATALELLGPDYRFKTKVSYNGNRNANTINGNIIIMGGADPTLGSSYFTTSENRRLFLRSWVKEIKDKGIETITGDLLVDPFIFEDNTIPRTWIWEDIGNYYGASAQGISVYDNTVHIHFETSNNDGEPTHILYTTPKIPGFNIENNVLSSTTAKDLAYVFGSPFDGDRIIKGTLPRKQSNFSIKASIPNPAELLAHDFYELLTNSGVEIQGKIIVQKTVEPDQNNVLIEWKSNDLASIIKQLNYHSVNLFAECLCKYIGLIETGIGSTETGTKAIIEFWEDRGINTENLFMEDGSGLSRFNAITAETLNSILVYMAQHSNYFETYKNSIPLAGLQGTQKYYFTKSKLKGLAHAKSGSMTRVRSFAGYMTTKKGTNIAFTTIVNNYTCTSTVMARKLESLIEEIYDYY